VSAPATPAPDWTRHVIWWHVYPLGFVGAEPELTGEPGGLGEPGEPHRLRRLIGWLDHLVSLGCNGLALGPVFTSGTHGYDTIDYFSIDPRLGDDDDFDALLAACRERGIRVLLDGVFNHDGERSPRVRAAFEGGPGSAAGSWFRLRADGEGRVRAASFEGHGQLVAFNHDNPEVQDFVAGVMEHWLERGVDGWRLDAAYAVPAAFWAAVLPRVRERFGEAWFVGEMIHGDYAGYVAESGIDAVTQYELWKATWSSLRDANLHELAWTLGRHAELLEQLVPLTFLGNHDVTRIACQVPDERHHGHAIALLGFLPGVPSVYYGDELGLRAVKEDRAGGDDAVRPAMPAGPGEVPDAHPEVTEVYRRVLGLRRRHPWLVDARVEATEVTNTSAVLVATPRAAGAQERPLRLVLNLGDDGLPLPDGAEVLEAGRPVDGHTLPPHAWAVVAG
jgi:glycosidase